ncbi:hypothetical protein DL98DRAFT_564018 [Cadophora sp. DSE1049]|nr:hypothetical protein DL98DRAFT_564018 [Cadophora sp. DSE1049]
MNVELSPPTIPLAISDHPISKSESTFSVHCHDRYFKSVTVTDNEIGKELSIKGTSGLPLFDLRHFNYFTENKWLVESPSRREIANTKHISRNACIAVMQLTGSNDITDLSNADSSTWYVRVAGGIDLALILVIGLCRAEMHHVFRT